VDEVVIRKGQLDDLDAVRDVYRRSSLSNEGDRDALLARPEILELSERPIAQGRTQVAVVGDRVVGFATTSRRGSALELDSLFVDPDHMRRGVGRALVLDAAAAAQRRGLSRIEVTANQHAVGFYTHAGFVAIGTVDSALGPAPRMELRLDAGRPGPGAAAF
jgi:GNAT superfamily N-acetyltransferase